MDRRKMLGEMPLLPLLVKQSLPAITGMLVMASYNIVDTLFVGWGVGPLAIAATAAAFPVQMFANALAMLSAVGTASRTSRALGAGCDARAETSLGNGFILSMVLGLLNLIFGILFMAPLIKLCGGSAPELQPLMREYLTIIFLGTPVSAMAMLFNNSIRAEGNMRYAMGSMIIPALVNTVLDPIFIFVFHMGIAGAAWATVLAQCCMFLWNLLYYTSGRTNNLVHLRISRMRPSFEALRDILGIGFSEFIRLSALSISGAIAMNQVARYGNSMYVAAIGLVFRINSLAIMPVFGIGQGLQPIVGYCYGSKQYTRARKAAELALVTATCVVVVLEVICMVFAPQLIKLFTNDAQLIAIGGPVLRTIQLGLCVVGVQITGTVIFQALGIALPALVLSLSRQILFFIPLMLILPSLFGIQGALSVYPVSDFCSFFLTAVLLWTYRKKFMNPEILANTESAANSSSRSQTEKTATPTDA